MQEENALKHLTWNKYQIFFKQCCDLFLHLINISFIYATYIQPFILKYFILAEKLQKKKNSTMSIFLPNFSMLTFYISIFLISFPPSSPYTLFFWNILSYNHVVHLPLNILQCIFLNILYNHNIIIKIRKLLVIVYLIYRLYSNITNCSINSHYCKRKNKCLFVRTGVQFRIKDFTYFFALVS